jgi:hypothetical protein
MHLPKDFNLNSVSLLSFYCFCLAFLLHLDKFHLWICALNKVGNNLGTALPCCLTR